MLRNSRLMRIRGRHAGGRQSRPFERRQRERMIIGVGAGVIAAVLLVFALSRLTMIPALSINSIAIEGADELVAPAVKAAAEEAIKGSYLGIFSRSNILLYPRKAVRKAVLEVSPRIEAASVEAWNRRTLAVRVEEKEPAALICPNLPEFDGSSLSADQAESCYFADADAVLFAESPQFSGAAYKRYYMPELALLLAAGSTTSLLGTNAFSKEDFDLIQEFFDGVRDSGIRAEAILVKDQGEFELYARNPERDAKGKGGGEDGNGENDNNGEGDENDSDTGSMVIYFNSGRSFTEQLANLVSFWTSMPDSYEYVDVRYGSNVFYRKKM